MLVRYGRKLRKEEEGVVFIEALLALPVLFLLAIGILEFGNMMWQRQQLQIGVRDAARYWSRCRPVANGVTFMPCTVANAQNVAVYGHPDGIGNPRVPGWTTEEVTVEPVSPPTAPLADSIVRVSTSTVYEGSPLYDGVLGGTVDLGYWVTMRYIGW